VADISPGFGQVFYAITARYMAMSRDECLYWSTGKGVSQVFLRGRILSLVLAYYQQDKMINLFLGTP
jgi:hypothetical protein